MKSSTMTRQVSISKDLNDCSTDELIGKTESTVGSGKTKLFASKVKTLPHWFVWHTSVADGWTEAKTVRHEKMSAADG